VTLCILIVEDEEPIAKLLAELLADEGYRVLHAGDGEQALIVVGRERPDLVLTDLMMPAMSGVELYQRLRADPRTRDIPVVIMSAVAGPPDSALGADAFLKKPFEVETLLELVARFAGPPQAACR
jgi:CheY-like chemotaxis protein